MRNFALDTEFIDTPTCSALLSLGLVSADGRELYVEFEYPKEEITPWLAQNVVPLLGARKVTMRQAAQEIRDFVGGSAADPPRFWAYVGAYDWYWLCRTFGGFMDMPRFYPILFEEFARYQEDVPNLYGPQHHALNDAKSLMHVMKARKLVK